MIETLLVCLPNAVGSAFYSLGPLPHLSLKLVSSARRYGQTDKIFWDEINKSSHNFTFKKWEDYRDHKGGVLEGLAWCVENQIGWTVDHSLSEGQNINDLPEKNGLDGFYHLEPILIKKAELGQRKVSLPHHPKNINAGTSDLVTWTLGREPAFAVLKHIRRQMYPSSKDSPSAVEPTPRPASAHRKA